jgi:hypothetical protein
MSGVSGTANVSHGNGWLRTRQVHSDFTLTAEFRLLDADTRAGVGIRALTGETRRPKHGYRLVLAASTPSGTIEACGTDMRSVTRNAVAAPGADTWHQEQAAVYTVLQWRFAPGKIDSKPVRTKVIVDLTFTLR